jgi:hypothetical protein
MSGLSDKATEVQGDFPDGSSRYWLAQIASAKRVYSKWHTRGDKVIARYKDEARAEATDQLRSGKKLNLLWSNVETTKPALYSRTPEPNISRRNKDADPVGRWASVVLERCVAASLDQQDFDSVMKAVVQDLLLPGQGIAIEEYGADIEGEGDAQTVKNQRSSTRYLHWKDWLTNPARIWPEVWWFGYRVWLTRDEVTKKFGEEIGKAIHLDHKPEEVKDAPATGQGDYKATIWTIWSMRHGMLFQVAPGLPDQILKELKPPTRHEGFWPFPRPVQATVASDSIIPVPDFAMYQDQAEAIDVLTNRINVLGKALKLRGLYPGDMDSIKRLLQDGADADMIPIENWAMLSERGGANGLVVWFPLKEVAAALVSCTEALQQQKALLYEVTGLGDIIRGASDPSETATAQQLKSQWGSLRVRDRQRDIQRFARDVVRRKAEVIAEHFTIPTLQQMSGVRLLTNQEKQAVEATIAYGQNYQQKAQALEQTGQPVPPPAMPPPDPQTMQLMQEPSWEDVLGLLRNDSLRGFLIDIETDSTVEPDQQAEQQNAIEFTTGVLQFLQAAAQVLPIEPQAAPMLGELLLFTVRRFKGGESMETAIENFTKAVAAPKPPPPPSPQVQAQQLRAQAEGTKAQTEQQTAVIKGHAEQVKAQAGIVQTMAEHHAAMAEKAADLAVAQQQVQPQPVVPLPAMVQP